GAGVAPIRQLDAELAREAVEVRPVHPERACGGRKVAGVLVEPLLDQLAPKVVDGFLQGRRADRPRGRPLHRAALDFGKIVRPEVLRRELDDLLAPLAFAQRTYDPAAQRMLELADVAGPRVSAQPAPCRAA